jgi:hypothetical protein
VCLRCARKRDNQYGTCSVCRVALKHATRRRNREVRQELLARLGNACRCCGERTPEFMTLDHVQNDGYLERMTVSPSTMYLRILKSAVVDRRYQLLCWNCNMAKAKYGLCPHQARRARGPALPKAPGRHPATVA